MYKNILVPLDGSKLAECVLPHVESIAKEGGVQNIFFIRVVEPFSMPASGEAGVFSEADRERVNSKRLADAKCYLDQLLSQTKYNGVNVKSEIITGKEAESITEYATKNDVDLIAKSLGLGECGRQSSTFFLCTCSDD